MEAQDKIIPPEDVTVVLPHLDLEREPTCPDSDDSGKTLPIVVVENHGVYCPEEVLDETTGLLRRALMAKETKEMGTVRAAASKSIEVEAMQIKSGSASDAEGLGEVPLGPEEEAEVSQEVIDDGETILNIRGMKIADLLYKDQLKRIQSLTDAQIVCEDGVVPFHRYILMAASVFIHKLLIFEDPSEMAVIHIPDVKVANIVQVLCILYTGKLVYKKSEERDIYAIFRMLGISTDSLQFRPSKPDDGSIGKLRYYAFEDDEDEEEFMPNIMDEGDREAEPASPNPSVDAPSISEAVTEEVSPEDQIYENRGPRVTSKSQIDKAETAKFLAIKMEMPEMDDSIVETEYKIKCRYCDIVHDSEESLSEHLSNHCGSHLVGKYSYSHKQCLGCRRKFPSFSLYGLINHVESCKRLQVAFSATASQFVNGTLPPISVKEEENSNDLEMGPPPMKIQKLQKNAKMKGKKGRKGKKSGAKRRKTSGKGRGRKKTAEAIVPPILTPEVETPEAPPTIKIVDFSQLGDVAQTDSNSQSTSSMSTSTSTPSNDNPPGGNTLKSSTSTGGGAENVPEVILIDDDDESDYGGGDKPKSELDNGLEDDDCEYVIENNESFKDISSVPMSDLKLLLTSCPVCKKRYNKLKTASKCLRGHGLRRCWICLKLIRADGQNFLSHNTKYHIITGTEGKVECSFCKKQFGYNIGLNTHMGNFHFSRLLETTTKDFEAEEPLTAHQIKTLNSLNQGVGDDVSESSVTVSVFDRLVQEKKRDGENVQEIMDIDDDSDIEEIPISPPLPIVRLSIPVVPGQFSSSNSSPIPSTSAQSQNPGTSKSLMGNASKPVQQTNLGRVLLEIKEINGIVYNVYGLINPTSKDPNKKFSKVIAIRNTDVSTKKS